MFSCKNLCRPLSLLLFAVSLAVGPNSWLETVAAAEPQFGPRILNYDHLSARLAADGSVRVIVELRADAGDVPLPRTEGRLSRTEEITARRATIVALQDRLITRLHGLRRTTVKRLQTIPYVAMEVDAEGLDTLLRAPEVELVREDGVVRPVLGQSVFLIGADLAWAEGYSGAGQAIAIIDTGVDFTHPFLAGKVVSEACFSTTGDDSESVCPDGTNPLGVDEQIGPGAAAPCDFDLCWHGTHVAGIAAGKGTNSGVARDADIIAIQVFSYFPTCGGGGNPAFPDSWSGLSVDASGGCVLAWESDIMRGLERVYALRNDFSIASVNMSLGGETFDRMAQCDADRPDMKAAIDNLRGVDIATVIASGNSGDNVGISTPGCISSAISVGATSKSDLVASFSNRASWLSLFAPGVSIVSSVLNEGFASASGTSMATPHVAGAWAVIKSRQSNATVDEVLAALRLTGITVPDSSNTFNTVRIQVDAAVDAFVPGDPLPFDEIIDNGAPETGFTGNWTLVADVKSYGGEAMRATGPGNSYRFTPVLAGPEYYRLSVWWSEAPSRSDQVEVRIQSATGLTTVVVDQQVDGGNWQELGVFAFAGDGTDYVEVADPAGGEVIADAVRLSSIAPLQIETTSLFDAGLNMGYYQVLSAVGGVEPYTWDVVAGNWPPGLVLDPGTGVISGVPTAIGTYDFSVEVQDSRIPADFHTQALSISVSSTPPDVDIVVDQKDRNTSFIGTWSLSGVGGAYNGASLYGNGDGVDSFRFHPILPLEGQYRVSAWWTANSNRSNQVAHDIVHDGQTETVVVDQQIDGGQWNELGLFFFPEGAQDFVEVSDRNGPFAVADAVRFELVEAGMPNPVIETAVLPNGTVGIAYDQALQAAGGATPYTWSIVGGSLPQGLSLAGDGVIGGTPVAAESTEFTVQVEDGNLQVATRVLTLDIDAAPSLELVIDNGDPETSSTGIWSASGLAGGYNGVSLYGAGAGTDTYRYTPDLPQSGQYRVYAWWTAHGNRSDRATYEIGHSQGTHTVEVDQRVGGGQWNELGVFAFASGTAGFVEVSDRNGAYVVADAVRFELVGTALVVTTSALPNGVVGQQYDQTLAATGGIAPYTWSLIGGSLPLGMSLADDGRISGIPTEVEASGFTVQVQDANMGSATRTLSITIETGSPPMDIVIDNGDPETSATGSWKASGVAGGYNDDSLFGNGAGVDAYRYTPDMVQAGQYRVHAWWTAHSNRSGQVVYSIQHAGGTSPVVVNQQLNGGQWNELGVFSFAAGNGGFVEVSDSNGPYAVADAVWFEYLPGG